MSSSKEIQLILSCCCAKFQEDSAWGLKKTNHQIRMYFLIQNQHNVVQPYVFWPNVFRSNVFWPNVFLPSVFWPNVCRNDGRRTDIAPLISPICFSYLIFHSEIDQPKFFENQKRFFPHFFQEFHFEMFLLPESNLSNKKLVGWLMAYLKNKGSTLLQMLKTYTQSKLKKT